MAKAKVAATAAKYAAPKRAPRAKTPPAPVPATRYKIWSWDSI